MFKTFKRPLKLSHLQQTAIDQNHPKKVTLQLDVATRWNSVIPMVSRYLEIKHLIKLTLEQSGDADKFTTKHDVVLLEMVVALEPLKDAILEMSKANSNLMQAEFVMRYVFEKLDSSDFKLSKELLDSTKLRYEQRRNQKIVTSLLVLQTGKFPEDTTFLKYSSKREIKQFIADILEKLFPVDLDTVSQGAQSEVIGSLTIASGIESYMSLISASASPTLDKELMALHSTGIRSARLEKLFQALLSLKPTSTVCEQAFSVAASIKTKNRNKMSPKKLNVILWLKYFFTNKQ